MKIEKNKGSISYDKKGDYLEILFKKCEDTYFNEKKKDYCEIIETNTNKVVGYAIFNFIKRKQNFIDLELPIPKGLVA